MRRKTTKAKKAKARTGKVAVIVSQFEGDLSGGLDMARFKRDVKAIHGVGLFKIQAYPGTKAEIARFASEAARRGMAWIVVAGSSERLYGKLYRDVFAGVGIDASKVAFADITDHCVFSHRGSKPEATACAVRLIELAVARVLGTVRPERIEVTVKPSCVVIGAGVAGISAAGALRTRGVSVTLVDREDKIGGLLNRLNVVFPAYVPSQDFLKQQAQQLEQDRIEVITGAEPVGVSGHVGDYRMELSNGRTLEAGTIIVATGAGLLDPGGLFGYGSVDKVITHIELEAMLKANKQPGSDIVMIQCAGSRNEVRPYCSRVCCTASIKNTILIKERYPSSRITILSRGFAEYAGDLDRARQMGVEIIRYSPERPPVVGEDTVQVYDEISDMEAHIHFDRVVLAVPMVPSESTRALAKMLKIPTDQFGFVVEPHLRVRPEEFAPRGIFVAGCAHWPSTITESILQGYGAASRAYEVISRGTIERTSYVARVDEGFCRGCGRCEEVCGHGAIDLSTDEDGMKRARVIPIQCTGCGVCTSVCPSGAISLADMSPEQFDLAIDAIGGS